MIQKITLNDANYHYHDIGTGEAILLLHGFTGTMHTWSATRDSLSSTYRVITPDLLGHGGTDSPTSPERYAMPHASADLIHLLDTLNIERVHLGGYSMGGRLALYMANHHSDRIRSLMLIGASAGLREHTERQARRQADNALANRIEQDGLMEFVDAWEKLPLWDKQSAELKQTLRVERLAQNPHGLANSLRGMGTGVQPALWDALPQLQAPTRLFVGQADSKFININNAMLEHLPNAKLHIIHDAGHAVHLEKPQAFILAYRDFLAEIS
jgi:2-succinyl-6-hydroxy-2,4-cyclohexadiene-1-carboxylate synthase